MATKKMVLITLLDNKDYIVEKAKELGVTIHRSYETEGTSPLGKFEAMAFVVSGNGVEDLLEDLNDFDEFGF